MTQRAKTRRVVATTVADGKDERIDHAELHHGLGLSVLITTWTPEDITLNETAVVLSIPDGAMVLSAGLKIITAPDPETESDLELLGLFEGDFSFDARIYAPLTVGAWLYGSPIATANAIPGPSSMSMHYNSSATPGLTKPVVEIRVVILGGVWS